MEPLRDRVWALLQPAEDGDRWSRFVDLFIISVVLISIASSVLSTEDALYQSAPRVFDAIDAVSGVVFVVEYLLRLWSCTADPRFRRVLIGRARWMASPLAIVDLLAVLPMLISVLPIDLRVLRLLRVMRLLRVLKLTRYSAAAALMRDVLVRTREQLVLTIGLLAGLLLLTATLMYAVEGDAQPEQFGSVPRAMWWSIVTLTTIGYGDVYPVTPIGRALAAVVAVLGIGLVALPTGIIGAGYVAEIERRKEA